MKATRSYEERWAAYSMAQGEPEVLPVLVVQVPDKASDAKLGELVSTIEEEWPGLGPHAIAHVLGEHQTLTLGSRTVEWVYPESIQTDTDVRVVFAKEAISTGWDCPRAEVLYSERPRRTRRTSPRSSAGWCASRSRIGLRLTTPSTRSCATCRCSTARPDVDQGRARGHGTG